MELFTRSPKQIKSPAHRLCFCLTLSAFHLVFVVAVRIFALITDPVEGTVNVKNVSASASGTYRCVASNRVGSDECVLNLQVTSRKYSTNFMLMHSSLFSLFHIQTFCSSGV